MPDALPPDLRRLIERYVPSLMYLETLLLLLRDPNRAVTSAEAAKELYVAPEAAEAQLAQLERDGFLRRADPSETGYRYQPSDAETDRLVHELAQVYQERRVTIITLIYSKPVSRVQTFADAFRLRKEP